MPFSCQQCGECCTRMGYVFEIVADHGGYAFTVRNQYLGDQTEVQVAPEMLPLFLDRAVFERYPHACPFLRFDPGGKAFCTVHLTRPDMCRDFGCWRLLILRPDGRRAGRVMCQSHFCPDDSDLARLWEERIRPIDDPGGAEWDRSVISILTRAGYQVRI